MEAIAFAIGLEPILTRGQQLVDQYLTWKGNKEQAPELFDAFKALETDLAACITHLQENAANLPHESRAIIDNDIATLSGYLTSARAAVQSINKRIHRNRMLQFFRANAVAKDCGTLRAKLEDARKLLRDADKYVDNRSVSHRLEMGQREIVDRLKTSFPAPSPTATAAEGSACRTEGDAFHAYFDVPYDTSKLVFNFDAKNGNGNALTQEGRLLKLLLDESPQMNREVAVRGIGGVGKSSLLKGIMSLNIIRERFEDGVYNILLGMDATHGDLIESLSCVVRNSGGNERAETMRGETNAKKVMNMFRSWFANKKCLFLVDDVWETKEISLSNIHGLIKLYASGRDSKVVLTTRSGKIACEADTYFSLEPRGSLEYESRAILLHYSGIEPENGEQDDNKVVNEILGQCSGLPLFLAVAGKTVRTLSFRRGHGGCMAYHDYAKGFTSNMQNLLATDVGDYERLSARLMLSLDLLEERKQDLEFRVESTMAQLHRRLSVMTKQTRVPMNMLKQLWELEDESQAATVAREFEQVGLAEVEFERKGSGAAELLRLHDSVHRFAVSETRRHQEEIVGHETLVRRYGEGIMVEGMWGEWWRKCVEPDGYIHGNICRHLLAAGRASELVRLLLKPQWAECQLNVNGIPFLKDDFSLGIEAVQNGMADYGDEERCETENALQLISDAVTLSSAFISKKGANLWFQLHGRLKRYGDRVRGIREYVDWMETDAPRPVALCLNDFLAGPGGPNTKITSVGAPMLCMVMLGDGELVACGCGKGIIAVVNIHESEFVIEKSWKAHEETVWAIGVARNGTRLVSGSQDWTAKVWDVATRCCVATFRGHTAAVRGVAVLKDGKRVVSVSADGTAQVWEMDTRRVLLPPFTGHEGSVNCVAVLRDKDEFITGGEDGQLRLWSATSGDQVGDPFEGHEREINSVAVTLDGHRIVSGSYDGTVRMWDVGSHKQIFDSFKGDSGQDKHVAFSRDGRRIVSGSFDDFTIRVWESGSGNEVCDPLEGHGQLVMGVLFLTSVDSIVSCSIDGTIRVWDIRKAPFRAERITDRHSSIVTGVSFTPNGKLVVSASSDSTLRIWESTTGQQIGDPLVGHSGSIHDVAVTPNGRYIVSVSDDKTIDVWDLESCELLHTFKGHTDEIWCVTVTPKGDLAATGSKDKSVRIWDLSAMDSSHVVLEGHSAIVWSVFVTDDGLRIVSVDKEGEIFVWELETRDVAKRFRHEDAHVLSRQEVLNLIGESTVRDNGGLSIPLGGCEIIYDQRPVEKVIATLESIVISWALSPDKQTLCVGLYDGRVGFLKLVT